MQANGSMTDFMPSLEFIAIHKDIHKIPTLALMEHVGDFGPFLT